MYRITLEGEQTSTLQRRKNRGLKEYYYPILPAFFPFYSCIFNEKCDNPSLRVSYEGTFRSKGSNGCNRRYLTFDGADYAKPTTRKIVYVHTIQVSPHRPHHFESYGDQAPPGHLPCGFLCRQVCESGRWLYWLGFRVPYCD